MLKTSKKNPKEKNTRNKYNRQFIKTDNSQIQLEVIHLGK